MELHVDREHSALAKGVLKKCPAGNSKGQLALDL